MAWILRYLRIQRLKMRLLVVEAGLSFLVMLRGGSAGKNVDQRTLEIDGLD